MSTPKAEPDYDLVREVLRPGRTRVPTSGLRAQQERDRPGRSPRTGPRLTTESRPGIEVERSGWPAEGRDAVTPLEAIPTPAVDAVRFFLASLQHQDHADEVPTRLGFTSSLGGEGVTFIARTVAAVLAHDARERVCVVDLNWVEPGPDRARRKRRSRRRRRALDAQPPSRSIGLAEVLRREASLRSVMLETDDPRLTVVSSGTATAAEGQVFARSERLGQLLETLERHHDRLVVDLPPVLASSTTIPLARHAGALSLVVRQGVTTESQVRLALDRLGPNASVGVVLNRASSHIPGPILRRLSSW